MIVVVECSTLLNDQTETLLASLRLKYLRVLAILDTPNVCYEKSCADLGESLRKSNKQA